MTHSLLRFSYILQGQTMNFALTRARYAMYIVCNFRTLNQISDWRACFDDAQSRGAGTIVHINEKYGKVFPFNKILEKSAQK